MEKAMCFINERYSLKTQKRNKITKQSPHPAFHLRPFDDELIMNYE